ncbi:MAG: pyridoxamine 5'-phosphate oxidase family protein [Pseudomonadales bacterium]|nr:pyridoxamine 5'-phosphate oxidase family protein [Pseudomonadales bacterium]MCP5184142.1 pyridoxamine 5'-phosphate oxidase family protein [Pseudomonadales bacterium]
MIDVDETIRERINRAIDAKKTLAASYVDEHGKPHISFYGSTHFHAPDTLGLWVRNPDNALLRTISTRPDMAFIYGDIGDTVYCTMEGTARVVTDPAVRQRVYDEMHPIERHFDQAMAGVAVLVDLQRVTVLSKAGKVVQTRH